MLNQSRRTALEAVIEEAVSASGYARQKERTLVLKTTILRVLHACRLVLLSFCNVLIRLPAE